MNKFEISISCYAVTEIGSMHGGRWQGTINASTVDKAIEMAHADMDRLGYHKWRGVPEVNYLREVELTEQNGWATHPTAPEVK